jgi:hypothetical protein
MSILHVFKKSQCLTMADSAYTFMHGGGKLYGTVFFQMVQNTLLNHQGLAQQQGVCAGSSDLLGFIFFSHLPVRVEESYVC